VKLDKVFPLEQAREAHIRGKVVKDRRLTITSINSAILSMIL
jgi:hypothetical protein